MLLLNLLFQEDSSADSRRSRENRGCGTERCCTHCAAVGYPRDFTEAPALACCAIFRFSAIYFPSYWHLKKDVFREGYNGKQLSFLETLGSAAIA